MIFDRKTKGIKTIDGEINYFDYEIPALDLNNI